MSIREICGFKKLEIKTIKIEYARQVPTAMLCGGQFRGMLSRVQWQAIVIPTLAGDAARGLRPQRLNILKAGVLAPRTPTMPDVMAALADWAADNGYGKVEIVELWPPERI